MYTHGFIRVAAATPTVRVGDCMFNAQHIVSLMGQAQAAGTAVVVFPELSLTGYTCGDLFHQPALHHSALEALAVVVEASRSVYAGVAIVGLPLVVDHLLYNVAVAIQYDDDLAPVLRRAIDGRQGGRPRSWPMMPASRPMEDPP